MKVIDAAAVERLFSMEDAIEADRLAFQLYSKGACQTPQRVHMTTEDGTGTFLFMPSYCPELGYVSVKNINLFPDNPQKGKPTSYAQILLIDANDGQCAALIDGSAVTRLRTGAVTGVAFAALANPECEKAALFGTGEQAVTQLQALFSVRNPKEVWVCGRNQQKTEEFVRRMEQTYPVTFHTTTDGDLAATDADLIITATTSAQPLFSTDCVKSGCTLSCIGNYHSNQTELPLELFRRVSKVYFDAENAVLEEAGEIIMAMENGQLKKEKLIGEMGDLLSGKLIGRSSSEEIIVFKSVGIGIQDLVAAKTIFQKAGNSAIL